MRIVIVTAGSRGDVAPFTGLGQRLQQAGHEVALAAHDRFAGLVRDGGLEHRVLPGDPVELVRARTAAPSPEAAVSVFSEFLDGLGDGIVAAAAGADLLLTAFGPAPLSRAVAAALKIPSGGVYLTPVLWEPDESLYAGVLRRLGLPRVDSSAFVCHGYSPVVVPDPLAHGYWWPALPPKWQPPALLVDFLAAGPAPVFVGFGSMTPNGSRLRETVTAAIRQAGVRAIVQSGWGDLAAYGDDVLVADEVPHEWLFPRMAAVVHHGGAGTAGAGLRAGVPAVIVPMLVDQPFWASRLHEIGVAPAPLPFAELSAAGLAAALRECQGYRERAAEVGRLVRQEDGAGGVLSALDRFVAG